MQKNECLFEIGTEELPPKLIHVLARQLGENLSKLLKEAKLHSQGYSSFASPRRLAILIHDLDEKQQDYVIEKKGPALQLAYDFRGEPTKAALGFAKSCQTDITDLTIKQYNDQKFLVYNYKIMGQPIKNILPDLCRQAIKELTFPRSMRWGDGNHEFIRPVHWVVLLYDNKLIPTEILGVKTEQYTYGHRFHHPDKIILKHPNNYQEELKTIGFVLADFSERRKKIHQQIKNKAAEISAIPVIDADLLDEVTGLVEWPTALLCAFDEEFLSVPEEVLISSMQTHQKAFHLVDKTGKLLPYFITVSNIKSKEVSQVIRGNERVMRARLSDAAFFYQTDCKETLTQRLEFLKHVIFQKKLGSLYDRAVRLSKLSGMIANKLNLDEDMAEQAGLLAKADLVSNMVEEFPELQGIMGYYYALNDQLNEDVAMGIRGQYMPRFSGDDLPFSDNGCVVALADRIDKLTGIFGIGKKPSGEKDPFGLRRAALGLLQIIIHKKYDLDLVELITKSQMQYQGKLTNPHTMEDVLSFIMERLRQWYQDQKISVDTINAVAAKNISKPYDFHLRIQGVEAFRKLPEANSLAAANKRVRNIFTKENITSVINTVSFDCLELEAEKELAQKIADKKELIGPYIKTHDYEKILQSLADLQSAVDRFFDDVMVMVENEKLRHNRLALLSELRQLFLEVADISKLQS